MRSALNGRTGRITAALVALLAIAVLTSAALVSAQANRPAAVTGFQASTGADGEINVTWDAHPQTVKDYRVTWAKPDENFKKWNVSGYNAFPTDTDHTITGLDAGESYKLKVRARFDQGKSSHWSNTLTVSAGGTAPPPTPTPTPTATATPVPTPTPTATPVPTATPAPTPTATPVPTATPAPTPTATPAPTATPTTEPVQVRGLAASQQQAINPVTVSWTAADRADSYQVEREHNPSVSGDPTVWNLGNVTSHQDSGVEYNTSYRYRVRAKNDAGYGAWSRWTRITTQREPGTPAAPTDVEATEETAGQVVVTWTAPSGTEEVNGYRVRRQKVGLNHPVTTFHAGPTATSYTDDTVAPETMYDYWVVAWNDTGDSPNSRTDFITTGVQTSGVPNAPSRPTLSEETRGEVVIAWTADISGPDPSGYRVYRKRVGLADYDLLATTVALTHTDDAVEEETWYDYRIRAYNDAGESTASRYETIRTRVQTEGVPNAPTGVSASEDTAGEVTVTWTAPADGPAPTKYRVTRKKNGSLEETTTEVTATSYTDSDVEAETLYGYRVRAINDAGDGDESGTDWIKTGVQTQGAPGTPDDTDADQ